MFTAVFETLSNVSRGGVVFAHIDQTNRGLRTITLDMCRKQAGGKLFLRSAYTKHILISFRLRGLLTFPGWSFRLV